MRPFNLKEAKEGKPVVTKDGLPVRILDWNLKGPYPIVAAIVCENENEAVFTYTEKGEEIEGVADSGFNLVMKEDIDNLPKSFKEYKKLRNGKQEKSYALYLETLRILLHVRDYYRQGWEPDWNDLQQKKYAISSYNNRITSNILRGGHANFCFQTAELRDLFLENFKEQLEIVLLENPNAINHTFGSDFDVDKVILDIETFSKY